MENQTPDTGGLYLDQLVSTGKPSLAHLTVVDGLVRDFVAGVLALKSGFVAGHPDAKYPLLEIEKRARHLGDAFLGRDPAYDAQPYNNISRLGAQLRYLFPKETAHYEDAGAALFMWLANQTLNAAKAQNEGTPEPEVQKRLGAVVDDVISRLLGASA